MESRHTFLVAQIPPHLQDGCFTSMLQRIREQTHLRRSPHAGGTKIVPLLQRALKCCPIGFQPWQNQVGIQQHIIFTRESHI